MRRPVTNVSASVRARLRNISKSTGRSFNELLQYYAIERFLYRLSRSPHADQFVLKGALMFHVWSAAEARSTKDIDMLGKVEHSIDRLLAAVGDCLAVEVDDDGISFDPATVQAEEIRLHTKYKGVRVRFGAAVGTARVMLQLDVGFGDAVVPAPVQIVYPVLLDFPAPKLLGYSPENVVAEKFHAMVELDAANSRMKDFYDVWHLASHVRFEGSALAEAIRATFQRRSMPLAAETPVCLTPAFYERTDKRAQWTAFLRKGRLAALEFSHAAALIEVFLIPVAAALAGRDGFDRIWKPGGPWEG